MSILIVGASGNMGRRYSSILDYLQVAWTGVDKEHSEQYILNQAINSDGIIVATPTNRHVADIERFLRFKKPILCEKPVTRDMRELTLLMEEIRKSKTPFRMVYQYSMLASRSGVGLPSRYNYYKHGGDGLAWDCIQILGLANGAVTLQENSPMWECVINGKALDISHMDSAYIEYVQLWLKTPSQSLREILQIHEKVHLYIAENMKGAFNA